jgi:hypothetical protein
MAETFVRTFCEEYGTAYCPPPLGSRVGIAVHTLGVHPLNGMRIAQHGSVCGWYLWGGGEPSEAEDYFVPMCVEHLSEQCPAALPFLALPPGWRFLADANYVDVWYDASLLTHECTQRT